MKSQESPVQQYTKKVLYWSTETNRNVSVVDRVTDRLLSTSYFLTTWLQSKKSRINKKTTTVHDSSTTTTNRGLSRGLGTSGTREVPVNVRVR